MNARFGRCWGLLALVAFVPTNAHAFHDEVEHITDDTAWTAESASVRLGLYKVEVALHDRFTLGTYTWPWLLRVASLYGKWRFYSGTDWVWATRFGLYRLDTGAFPNAGPGAPIFTVFPFEVVSSVAIDGNDQLSPALAFTAVNFIGDSTGSELSGVAQGGVSNLQLVAAWEHRFSRTSALVVTGRYLLFQVAQADARVVLRPDAFTTIEVVGGGRDDESLNFRRAFSIVPAMHWSWETFNLRLGLGYGNLNVPGINFMVPNKSLLLDVDLYWYFD